ncbi:MAG: hypothetical protein WD118_06835 [Phycisphaeraceae bacterium]
MVTETRLEALSREAEGIIAQIREHERTPKSGPELLRLYHNGQRVLAEARELEPCV